MRVPRVKPVALRASILARAMSRPRPRSIALAIGALLTSPFASAMEQCRVLPGMAPASPCTTVAQAIGYLLLPALLAIAISYFGGRAVRPKWLAPIVVAAPLVACVLWEVLAVGLLGGVLAPCSASCWY